MRDGEIRVVVSRSEAYEKSRSRPLSEDSSRFEKRDDAIQFFKKKRSKQKANAGQMLNRSNRAGYPMILHPPGPMSIGAILI